MTSLPLRKLSLVPVQPARPEVSEVPGSETRLSPRAVAEATPHQPVLGLRRLSRESFLSGDFRVIDVRRQGDELVALLQSASLSVSHREREVMEGVLQGETDREIAQRLCITRQCVCGHLTNALDRVGLPHRFSALYLYRILLEVERGRSGRARYAEVRYGKESFLSVRLNVPPRPELELRLSDIEQTVAFAVCDGLTNREIAEQRGVAERTIANQVASLFHKLRCSRRFDVALFLLGLR